MGENECLHEFIQSSSLCKQEKNLKKRRSYTKAQSNVSACPDSEEAASLMNKTVAI